MAEKDSIVLTFDVDSDDFTRAGEASSRLKRTLKQMGLPPDIIRRISIVMYEGEINMVIHAHGGKITVTVSRMWKRPCRPVGLPPARRSASRGLVQAWACPT